MWVSGNIDPLFLTSTLVGVSDQIHDRAALAPGKQPPLKVKSKKVKLSL
jgi:hypothetical protein